jgi:ribosomal protein L7/L12
MAKVILESWRVGLRKVSLSKLQYEMLDIGLQESKSNVDSLLDNKEIILEIEDVDLAKKFLEEADKIGVNCKLIT